jgi:ABC-2 type transport system permease protein
VTNLGAMALGGLGGGFVPVESLPDWIEPVAPISPVYWAMKGYRSAILDGGGVGDVLGPLAVLVAFTAVFAGIALWRLELDAPKRTWG